MNNNSDIYYSANIRSFLNIETDDNTIKDVHSSGLSFKSYEKLLLGKAPLDAVNILSKMCEMNSVSNTIAASMALENALEITISENQKLARAFTHGSAFLKNHIRHFYIYTLPFYIKADDFLPLHYSLSEDFRIPKNYTDILLANRLKAIQLIKASTELSLIFGLSAKNINTSSIINAKVLLKKIKTFISNNMVQDIYTIAKYYSDYFNIGTGCHNLMSYGLFKSFQNNDMFYLNPLVQIGDKLKPLNSKNIAENIYYSQCSHSINTKNQSGSLWIKTPRYESLPMEVGPLARMLLSDNCGKGSSTMDRNIARVLEAENISQIMEYILDNMFEESKNCEKHKIPANSAGKGLIDSPKGALGHWITIRNSKIYKYNIITPNEWNFSPSDSNGVHSVIESSLIGTHLENIDYPIEIGRIIQSFDPGIKFNLILNGSLLNPVKIQL